MTITLDKITNANLKAALASTDTKVSQYATALYGVLGDALGIAEKFSRDELASAATESGIRFQDNTTKIGLAVKLVFRNIDRSRSSAYTVVITKAQAEGIEPEKLTEWIKTKGGLEKARTAASTDSKGLTDAQKKVAARKAIVAKGQAFMNERHTSEVIVRAPNAAKHVLSVAATTKTAIWLMRQTEDGNFELVAVSTNTESMTHKLGLALADPKSVDDFAVIAEKPIKATDTKNAALKSAAATETK